MATKRRRVLYQGESLTFMTRDPEFLFTKGNTHYPPPAVIAYLEKVKPSGFVIEEEEEEEAPPAVAPAGGKEKAK